MGGFSRERMGWDGRMGWEDGMGGWDGRMDRYIYLTGTA